MKKNLIQLCLALAAICQPVEAAPPGKQQVLFAAGKSSKSVSTRITGRNVYDFLVNAKAGQFLSVTQKPGTKVYFNVNSPGSQLALFNGSISGIQMKDRMLPEDGIYTIRVYLMGDVMDQNDTVPATLDISVTGKPLVPLSQKKDAKVAQTSYHATASVACKYDLDSKVTHCQAGVIRRGKDGTATVILKMNGFVRSVLFVKGKAVASNSGESMKSSKEGDLTTVTFGENSEVYQIPDVFLAGD